MFLVRATCLCTLIGGEHKVKCFVKAIRLRSWPLGVGRVGMTVVWSRWAFCLLDRICTLCAILQGRTVDPRLASLRVPIRRAIWRLRL